MEKLNYHKLVNLRKRFSCFDCEASKEILEVIDKHLIIQKNISAEKDKERRIEYHNQSVECDICNKTMLRKSIYQHKKDLHK
jgi:hypothetical protein